MTQSTWEWLESLPIDQQKNIIEEVELFLSCGADSYIYTHDNGDGTFTLHTFRKKEDE
jgi:hypothetical protein